MSTHAIIARPEGDDWKGRYVHSDGNPIWTLKELARIITRDGYDVAAKTLLDDNYGWSSIRADQPARLPADHPYRKDRRFRPVKGYGVAYTDTVVDDTGYQQATADEWWRETNTDASWVYVITPGAVTVLVPNPYSEEYRRLASSTWAELSPDRLTEIETMGY